MSFSHNSAGIAALPIGNFGGSTFFRNSFAGPTTSVSVRPYFVQEKTDGKIWGVGIGLSFSGTKDAVFVPDGSGSGTFFDSRLTSMNVEGFHRYNVVKKSNFALFLQPTPYFNWTRSKTVDFGEALDALTFGLSGVAGATVDISDRVRMVAQSSFANLYLNTSNGFDDTDFGVALSSQASGISFGVEVRMK